MASKRRNHYEVVECRLCGNPVKAGTKVRLTLSWESIRQHEREDGTKQPYIGRNSKSGTICKSCAYWLSDKMDMERPR